MSQSPHPEPIPAKPILLGRLAYDALVESDGPRELLREEEPFWARLSGLLYDGYRAHVQQGHTFSVFGRNELPGGFKLVPAAGAGFEPQAMPGEAPTEAVATITPRPVTTVKSFDLPRGSVVDIVRSSGEIDPGWQIKSRSSAGQVLVTKNSENGTLSKQVSIDSLLMFNLFLIGENLPVKVPRTSGALDEGWITRGVKDDRILVEKPGVGRKQLTREQFFPFNQHLWNPEVEAPQSQERHRAIDVAAGSPVRLMRANGDWQDGWSVLSQADNGALTITRVSDQGPLKMTRPLAEILTQNPQLFPVGAPVRVARSNGQLDDGWFILEGGTDFVVVDKPGVGTKEVEPDALLEHNRDRLLGEGEGPTLSPGEEAIAQRWTFAREDCLEGWIWDGFADAGRGATLDSLGWATDPRREILVVDRLSDMALRRHLAFARELASQSTFQRATQLVRYVYDQMGGPIARIEARVAHACASLRGQTIRIGEAPRLLGGGLARHRALLFQVLAEEAGLKPLLVRGFAGVTVPSAHCWNELLFGETQRVLVDLCRAPDVAFALLSDPWTSKFYHSGTPGDRAGEPA